MSNVLRKVKRAWARRDGVHWVEIAGAKVRCLPWRRSQMSRSLAELLQKKFGRYW